MARLFLFLVVALVAVNAASASGETKHKPLELTSSNFWATVSNQEPWLLEFYAPWCKHCKNLEPIWNQVSEEMERRKNDGNPSINVAKIDATQHRDIADQFNIDGFPTIKRFDGKQVWTFKGERTKEEIIGWALSGYQKTAAEIAPTEPTLVDILREQHVKFAKDIDFILKYKKNAMAVVVVFALVLGTLFGVIFCFPKPKTKTA